MDLKKTIGKRAPDGAWEIPILGDIGFFGTNGEDLIRELRAIKPEAVKFIIYSPGGAVYDAIAVAGYVREQGIQCFAEIYGLCASAATVFAALAGPKNTAISPGSMFLVHMPYGGDEKAIDNATAFLVDLYVNAYGWTKSEAKKHMEAEDGQGVLWTAAEAKKLGVIGEIMEGAKVAARARTSINEQPTAMAENTKAIAIKVKAKLTTMEAIRSAMGEGTEIEVEVPVEEATASTLAEKEAAIAALQKEVDDLKAKQADEAAGQEARAQLETEANAAKADLVTAKADHEKAVKDLEAKHAAEIAELKKPLAYKTVADNQAAVVGGMPGVKTDDPNIVAIKNILSNTSEATKVVAKQEQA